jgi:hypothetical protein
MGPSAALISLASYIDWLHQVSATTIATSTMTMPMTHRVAAAIVSAGEWLGSIRCFMHSKVAPGGGRRSRPIG